MINENVKDEIKSRIKLSEIISQKIDLKRKIVVPSSDYVLFTMKKHHHLMLMTIKVFIIVLVVKNMVIFLILSWNLTMLTSTMH